jgi:cytochrome c biogenesis protein
MKKFDRLFLSLLTSVRFTVILLSLIAIIGIVGTFVPQEEPPFLSGLSRVFSFLQFYDIFHSFFFYTVMGLLTLNLVFCSLQRFWPSWERFRGRTAGKGKYTVKKFITTTLPFEVIREEMISSLRKRGFRIIPSRADGELSAHKGQISLLGVYIVHIGVVILILGALISSLWGIDGYVDIGEGETVETITIKGKEGKVWRLPFQLHLDRFDVEFYENGMPRQYKSYLSVLKGNSLINRGTVLVNHPMKVDGFNLYQASYAQKPDFARIEILTGKEKVGEVKAKEGDGFSLPGETKTHVFLLRLEANFMQMGPAAKLAVKAPGGEYVFWIFQNIEEILADNPGILKQFKILNPSLYRPYTFVLKDMEARYLSGLQVRSDPGAPLVGIAAIIITLGLVIVYFITYRYIYVQFQPSSTGTDIFITITGLRNEKRIENELTRLLRGIQA